MTGVTKKRSAKAGLPPGSLVHIGQRHREGVQVVRLRYDAAHFGENRIDALAGALPEPARPDVTWIRIDGLQDIALLEQAGEIFGLHPLTLEDILNTEQRPKIEDHGDHIFIVLRIFHESASGDCLVPEQISIVLGSNWLISLQEQEGSLFDPVRERLRSGRGRLRQEGSDYLAHALIDSIVDSYFAVLERLGERIETIEEDLIGRPSPATLQVIQTLKREMLLLRKSVWPLREMIGGLGRSDSPLIRESSVLYFRDIYDHAVQVIDTIETYRDMLSGMLDIYLSSISNRMNEIMKVLTIIATVFMPLTFLAGVYGMNFKVMPELEWPWGYFALWGVMVLIAAAMLMVFKRKNWL